MQIPNASHIGLGRKSGRDEERATGLPETKQRLNGLLTYVEEMARLTESAVFSMRNYRALAFYEHQLRDRVGILHDLVDDEGAVWLKLDRLQRHDPPAPPSAIEDWLEVSPDPGQEPRVAASRTATMSRVAASDLVRTGAVDPGDVADLEASEPAPDKVQVRLQLDRLPAVQRQVEAYLTGQWQRWSDAERPRRESIAIYDRFFALAQTIEAEGAENPTEVALGVGLALWRTQDRTIEHPLIEALVEIEIDPLTHTIRVRPRESDPQIYLKPFEELDNPGAARVREAAESHIAALAQQENGEAADGTADFSPFERASYEPILRRAATLLSSDGVYYPDTVHDPADRQPPTAGENLTITDSWAIYARPRGGNFFIQDVERLKRHVAATTPESLPPSAARLVSLPGDMAAGAGIDLSLSMSGETGGPDATEYPAGFDGDVFFPKPYNDAQLDIVHRLEAADGIVVQGPPGTGKSHTIANIVCHYLATGRNVLVTSKGEGALEVLRGHFPPELRDLTISLLTSERDGLRQLEKAVAFIANDVAGQDPARIDRERLSKEREILDLRREMAALDSTVRDWAEKQLTPIADNVWDSGDRMPANLAARVAQERPAHAWLEDRIGAGLDFDPQFTDADIAKLRAARRKVDADIVYLACQLPGDEDLPATKDVIAAHDDLTRADTLAQLAEADRMPALAAESDDTVECAEALLSALRDRRTILKEIADKQWLNELYRAWLAPEGERPDIAAVDALIDDMAKLSESRLAFIERPVSVPALGSERETVLAAVARAAEGKRPFPPLLPGKADAKALAAAIAVAGDKPGDAEHWSHVAAFLDYEAELKRLTARWTGVAEALDLPPAPEGDEATLAETGRWLADMHRSLNRLRETAIAFRDTWKTEIEPLFPYGIDAGETAADMAALDRAIAALENNLARIRLSAARDRLNETLTGLVPCDGPVVDALRGFLTTVVGDPQTTMDIVEQDWAALLAELGRIRALQDAFDEIERIAGAIEASGAPAWAARLRSEPADETADPLTPDDWRRSWEFRRLESHLEEIDPRAPLNDLAERRLALDRQMERAMSELVRLRTYIGLHGRMTEARLAALVRFISAVRRIGAGTGVRARRYRGDARRAMTECLASVPCWVMPTWRVSETLPADIGSFDLVIVDEASQSDAMALPALLRAKKVLVVGDDRQVSPASVGLEERKLLQLRRRHLTAQPFADMLMPGGSLYELAQTVYPGQRVLLNEHFRCVEAIIRFSTQFYPEQIAPLRIPTMAERLDPPLIDVYLPDGRRDDRKINPAEAMAIVDEIERLVSDPAFDDRTFGVVSLIGDAQAHHIRSLLIERIGEDRFMHHHIACGDAATFQGKERDVMFISMVASPGRAHAQTSLLWQQRFNVALSRARDRMYLFRSVEPSDLTNPRDLKARVIDHFRDPMPDRATGPERLIDRCETDLERALFTRLTEHGYHATPKVRAGDFELDLVVEGSDGRRLAICLDGDDGGGSPDWLDDWRRQKVLERVGWRIWRCWASSFALDPDACMADLIGTLEAAEIRPNEATPTAFDWVAHRTIRSETPEAEPAETNATVKAVVTGDRVVLAFADEPNRHYVLTVDRCASQSSCIGPGKRPPPWGVPE